MNNINDIIPGELPAFNNLAKQLVKVKQDGWAIQFIKNPSEEVQLAAVKQNGRAIYFILGKGIIPSIAVQRAAVLNHPFGALEGMIEHDFPISKMIQWTAAKEIKEQCLVSKIGHKTLDYLNPSVREYLFDQNNK